jgi:Flp pilus assembly protein TadG
MRPFRRGRWQKGQSMVEFAIILPILLTLCGAGVDFARVYSAFINVQEAARNAAEYIATDTTITNPTDAKAEAQRLVCLEIVGVVDATGKCPGDNSPEVTTATSPDSSWANSGTAATTVNIVVTEQFQMIFPYPLMDKGQWTLTADVTFSVIRGR